MFTKELVRNRMNEIPSGSFAKIIEIIFKGNLDEALHHLNGYIKNRDADSIDWIVSLAMDDKTIANFFEATQEEMGEFLEEWFWAGKTYSDFDIHEADASYLALYGINPLSLPTPNTVAHFDIDMIQDARRQFIFKWINAVILKSI